jgi:hypothetical protein
MLSVYPHSKTEKVHMNTQSPSTFERRSFLARLKGLASFGAVAAAANAQQKAAPAARWQPTRHDKDDWLDQLPGQHRLVFDTTTPEGLGDAMFFCNSFMGVNRSEYGLQNSDLAVVIVVRFRATPFGYTDAVWTKYGMPMSAQARVEDPKTRLAPKMNLYGAAGYGPLMSNRGVTWDALAKQGVHLAVCSVSTHGYAGNIAAATGANPDTIFGELTSNLVSNARMVPAGIVVVNRAQERGYSLVSA